MTAEEPDEIAREAVEAVDAKAQLWGTLPTLFTGVAFTLGLVLALVGNLVGGVVFVASSYWCLRLRDEPEDATRVG